MRTRWWNLQRFRQATLSLPSLTASIWNNTPAIINGHGGAFMRWWWTSPSQNLFSQELHRAKAMLRCQTDWCWGRSLRASSMTAVCSAYGRRLYAQEPKWTAWPLDGTCVAARSRDCANDCPDSACEFGDITGDRAILWKCQDLARDRCLKPDGHRSSPVDIPDFGGRVMRLTDVHGCVPPVSMLASAIQTWVHIAIPWCAANECIGELTPSQWWRRLTRLVVIALIAA